MRKNSGLAAVLSFFVCGLGQIYNGEIGKGLAMFFAYSTGACVVFMVSLFWAIPTVIFWIYGIFNAYMTAEKMNDNMIRFEVRQKQEAESQNSMSSTSSRRVPEGGFKRKVKGTIEHKNFKPID